MPHLEARLGNVRRAASTGERVPETNGMVPQQR